MKVKKWWWGTKTTRIPFGNKIIVFGTLDFGEGTYTEDLWNAGYEVHLSKLFGYKFLVFNKR